MPEILQGEERLRFALETCRARSELLDALEAIFTGLAEGSLLELPDEGNRELWDQVSPVLGHGVYSNYYLMCPRLLLIYQSCYIN